MTKMQGIAKVGNDLQRLRDLGWDATKVTQYKLASVDWMMGDLIQDSKEHKILIEANNIIG